LKNEIFRHIKHTFSARIAKCPENYFEKAEAPFLESSFKDGASVWLGGYIYRDGASV